MSRRMALKRLSLFGVSAGYVLLPAAYLLQERRPIESALRAAWESLGRIGAYETSPAHSLAPQTRTAPAARRNLFPEALKPFIDQAEHMRRLRRAAEPDWPDTIDEQLNRDRLNFVLFGYSEEHGESYDQMGGSPSILSYDLARQRVHTISFTRDLLTPELDNKLPNEPAVMRHVFKAGGFPLMRSVLEHASGLVVDFQAALKDTVLYDLIDQVSGPVRVMVERSHSGAPYRFNGVDQPGRAVRAGAHLMDAATAIGFLESEDENPSGRADDRSYRKSLVYSAVAAKLQTQITNPGFIFTLKNFLDAKLATGELLLDFQSDLATNAARATAALLSVFMTSNDSLEFVLPQAPPDRSLIVSDPQFGDPRSGVSRVFEMKIRAQSGALNGATGRPDNPAAAAAAMDLPDWVQIAEGDPTNPNLPGKYWQAVRTAIKSKLS